MWDARDGLDGIRAFEDIGVSRVIIPLFALGKNPLEGLARIGDEIIAKLA